MSDLRKRSFFREYLNDFKKNPDGKYVYCGRNYEFSGSGREKARYCIAVLLFCFMATVFAVLPECLKPVEMSRSYMTILPWAAQLICIFLNLWAGIRLIFRINDLKDYIYRATVLRLPKVAACSAVFAGVTLIAQIIFIVINGMSEDRLLTIIRPVFSVLNLILCIVFRRFLKAERFTEKKSKC